MTDVEESILSKIRSFCDYEDFCKVAKISENNLSNSILNRTLDRNVVYLDEYIQSRGLETKYPFITNLISLIKKDTQPQREEIVIKNKYTMEEPRSSTVSTLFSDSPVEQARFFEQPRTSERQPSPSPSQRTFEQPRTSERTFEQTSPSQRTFEQPRFFEQPRTSERTFEQTSPSQRTFEQPRTSEKQVSFEQPRFFEQPRTSERQPSPIPSQRTFEQPRTSETRPSFYQDQTYLGRDRQENINQFNLQDRRWDEQIPKRKIDESLNTTGIQFFSKGPGSVSLPNNKTLEFQEEYLSGNKGIFSVIIDGKEIIHFQKKGDQIIDNYHQFRKHYYVFYFIILIFFIILGIALLIILYVHLKVAFSDYIVTIFVILYILMIVFVITKFFW